MFRTFIVCALISFVTAAPAEDIDVVKNSRSMAEDESQAKIIKYENNVDKNRNYEFSFETSNGILRSESGMLMNKGEPDEHFYVYGEYTFTDPNGIVHNIRYQADKNGYEILPPPEVSVVASLPSSVVATMLG